MIPVGHNINKCLYFQGYYNLMHFTLQIFIDITVPHKNLLIVLWEVTHNLAFEQLERCF